MLMKRIYSSAVLITITMIAAFSEPVSSFLVVAITVLGLYEFFTMLERKGISIYKYFGVGMGTVIPLSIALRFELTKKWELLFIVMAMLFLTIMQFKRRQNTGAVIGISTTLFGILYVSWFFSFLMKIRLLPDYGMGFFGMVLLVTKLGDIGAYLVGSRFGRHPLIPRISPKKSVEGSVGGIIFSVLAGIACKPLIPFSYGHCALLGALLGVVGQLGDLSESLIKRDCQIKDSADIIPGMGGVLDLIDSLLFTAPVFYFYIQIVLKNF